MIPQPLHAGPVGINNPINFGSGINVSGLEFPGVPRTTLSVAGTFNMRFIPESFAKASLSMNYAHRSSTRGLTSAGVFGTPPYGVLGGRLTFNGAMSGYDFADFLLGMAQQASVQYGPGTVTLKGKSLAGFVNDDWRVNGRVTYSQQILQEFGWIEKGVGRGVDTPGSGYSQI